MEQSVIEDGKTIAIISYITVIGLVIAYLMNNGKNNAFAKFHIGQSFRIFLLALAIALTVNILISITGMGILSYLTYVPLVLLIIGIVNAINGKTEPVPLIGTIGA